MSFSPDKLRVILIVIQNLNLIIRAKENLKYRVAI